MRRFTYQRDDLTIYNNLPNKNGGALKKVHRQFHFIYNIIFEYDVLDLKFLYFIKALFIFNITEI